MKDAAVLKSDSNNVRSVITKEAHLARRKQVVVDKKEETKATKAAAAAKSLITTKGKLRKIPIKPSASSVTQAQPIQGPIDVFEEKQSALVELRTEVTVGDNTDYI